MSNNTELVTPYQGIVGYITTQMRKFLYLLNKMRVLKREEFIFYLNELQTFYDKTFRTHQKKVIQDLNFNVFAECFKILNMLLKNKRIDEIFYFSQMEKLVNIKYSNIHNLNKMETNSWEI